MKNNRLITVCIYDADGDLYNIIGYNTEALHIELIPNDTAATVQFFQYSRPVHRYEFTDLLTAQTFLMQIADFKRTEFYLTQTETFKIEGFINA